MKISNFKGSKKVGGECTVLSNLYQVLNPIKSGFQRNQKTPLRRKRGGKDAKLQTSVIVETENSLF